MGRVHDRAARGIGRIAVEHERQRRVIHSRQLAPVEDVVHPGMANAAALSIARIRAAGCGHITSATWRVPGAAISAAKRPLPADPPPLKWSDLRYVFDIKEDCNGKEALQARRDRREAAPGRCSGLAGPGHDGGDPADRCERGDLLSLASRVWRAED